MTDDPRAAVRAAAERILSTPSWGPFGADITLVARACLDGLEREAEITGLIKRVSRHLRSVASDLHILKKHGPYGASYLDCTWGLCHLNRELIGRLDLAAAPAAASELAAARERERAGKGERDDGR